MYSLALPITKETRFKNVNTLVNNMAVSFPVSRD
jgi:hypothetical protein